MARTLYYALEFVALHQNNPGYDISSDGGNPKLEIAGHEIFMHKWRAVDGRGDPGENPNRDWWDHEEWSISEATFRKPGDYNTAQGTYATETGTHTYRVWNATSVSDDFLIPVELSDSRLGAIAAAVLDDFRSALMDYAERRGLPLVDVANLLDDGSALHHALSEHIETQIDLIDRALDEKITAQEFDRLTDRATRTLLIDLLEAGGLPATLAAVARNLVVLRVNARDPDDAITEVGVNGIGLVGSYAGAAYADSFLFGSAGHDELSDPDSGPLAAGAGNDEVHGSFRGENLISGGSGRDTIVYAGEDPVYIDLGRGWARNGVASDTLVGFEGASGGRGNDTLVGSRRGDQLIGFSGDDFLAGGNGDDVLDGSQGADRVYGGEGTDTAVYISTPIRGGYAGVEVDLARAVQEDRNSGYTAEGGDELLDIENLQGGHGDDRFLGSPGANFLWGGGGEDALFGRNGRDVLFGNAGDDRVFGGYGGDKLTGGLDRDRLYGGLGPDVFLFRTVAEAGLGRARDVVEDFQRGIDSIGLRSIDADTTVRGNQAFDFIGGKALSGAAGDLRLRDGIVSGDVNGDGRADFQIELTGLKTIREADFVL